MSGQQLCEKSAGDVRLVGRTSRIPDRKIRST
ncbi:hypothetical protein DFH56_005408 [Clostridium beijerinckii]|nr:hypothetical protein [Clostridium beijerinckii]